MAIHFQAVVIGGGPAGAVTALELARAGISCLIVERSDGTGNRIGESLPPSATALLARLGLRERFLATNPLPCYGNRSSWGGDGRLMEYDFIRDSQGNGWHLDRCRFDAMLLKAAREAGACLMTEMRPVEIARTHTHRWRLHLAGSVGSRTVTAGMVVDASGRSAAFARGQEARRRRHDQLVSVVAFLSTRSEPTQDSTTLVEATPDGWWYSALLPDRRLSTAYLTDPDLLAARRGWTAAEWQTLLATTMHTRSRIDGHRYQLDAAPRVVAAGSSCLNRVVGDGWLAVGDAAASFDPLSSHGIVAAVSGGMRAASAIRDQLAGNPVGINAYAEQIARSYALYLWMQRAYYMEERRWQAESFWQRRSASQAIPKV
ncbi:MAG: NAD(P)/FAD-dependent oxidoreductase [Dehalococcoidia bacterium]